MKQIKIEAVLPDYEGEPVTQKDDEDGPERPFLVLDAIRQSLVKAFSQDAGEAVEIYRLGQKIMADGWDGSLEDAEHKLLVKVVKANTVGFFVLPLVPLLEALEAE